MAAVFRRIERESQFLSSKRSRPVFPLLTIATIVVVGLIALFHSTGHTRRLGDYPESRPWYGNQIDRSISIIVPTYKEKENISPLTTAIFDTLETSGINGEVIFVDDDSQDGTVEEVMALSVAGYNVRIIVRKNARGLSSAVVRGFEAAHERVLVVMDADLQHPPKSLPDLVEPLVSGQSDFVIGSRYVAGGRIGEWGLIRKIISIGASALAMPLARGIKDPMAGFFAIRKELYLASYANISPLGFKIGLELLVKCEPEDPMEVPITFSKRQQGASKLKLKTQRQYLQQLLSLYWYVSSFSVLCGLLAEFVGLLFLYRYMTRRRAHFF